jgi:glycerol kinase
MLATDTLTRTPGLLTTIAYTRGTDVGWALDGEIAAAGALVSWAIQVGIAGSLAELDALAAQVPTTEVVLVPAIQGLGAPHWRDDVSAAFIGMTAETDRRHLARAVHDAIAWSLFDVVEAFAAAGPRPRELSVDGGLTNSDFLLQRCADVLQIPLRLCGHAEATAYGAAALAMLGIGLATVQDVRDGASGTRLIEPHAPPPAHEQIGWRRALASALGIPTLA